MVHISMEASEGCAVPKDLFLSLRVGDIQKFSKAGAAKTYKFPAAAVGDRRYGKIEVYKRIGICSVMIDPGTLQGAHEISVPLDDDRLPNLRYRFNLAAGEVPPSTPGGATKQETQSIDDKPLKEKREDLQGRVKAAKDYLDKHQLEIRLSEAMQAVLRERPDDPGAFVANKLVNRIGMVTKVDVDAEAKNPPRKEASAAPEAPPEAPPQAPAEEAPAAEAASASEEEADAALAATVRLTPLPSPKPQDLAERIARLPKGWRGALVQLLEDAEAAELAGKSEVDLSVLSAGGDGAARSADGGDAPAEARPSAAAVSQP